ncbi:hypothetical protein Aglo01_51050 [Actinokineospora globicatena]|nr:hypothetical protein Aglo01_51050 [Actinokineospora globicatena]
MIGEHVEIVHFDRCPGPTVHSGRGGNPARPDGDVPVAPGSAIPSIPSVPTGKRRHAGARRVVRVATIGEPQRLALLPPRRERASTETSARPGGCVRTRAPGPAWSPGTRR